MLPKYRYGYEFVGDALRADTLTPLPDATLRHLLSCFAAGKWAVLPSDASGQVIAAARTLGRRVIFISASTDLAQARRICRGILASGAIGVFERLSDYSQDMLALVAQLAAAYAYAKTTGAGEVCLAGSMTRLQEGASFVVISAAATNNNAARSEEGSCSLEQLVPELIAVACTFPPPAADPDGLKDSLMVMLTAAGFCDAEPVASAALRCRYALALPPGSAAATASIGSLGKVVACAKAFLGRDAPERSASFDAMSAACVHVFGQLSGIDPAQVRPIVEEVFGRCLTGPALDLLEGNEAAQLRTGLQEAFLGAGLVATEEALAAATTLSLALRWNSCVALTGPAGCGKTTVYVSAHGVSAGPLLFPPRPRPHASLHTLADTHSIGLLQ